MATVDFTATHDGQTATRSSGTMPYVAAVFGVGVTWHKTFAAAHKAARSGQHVWNNPAGGVVVPAVPVKFNGKPTHRWPEVVTEGWGDIPAATMAALLADKLPQAEVAPEPVEEAPSAPVAAPAVPTGASILAGAVAAAEADAEVDYFVTRDTADHMASDETRAMAHVRIAHTTTLEMAQFRLAEALVDEARYLTARRDVLRVGDAWAFRRAAALVELSARVGDLDPRTNPGPHKVITRTVEGLLFSIVEVPRRR